MERTNDMWVLIELQKMLNEARRNIGKTIIDVDANRESARGFEKTIMAIEDKCLSSVFDLACAAYLDGKMIPDTFYCLFGREILKKASKFDENSLTGKLIGHIKRLKERHEIDGDLSASKNDDKTTVKAKDPFCWLMDNLNELEKARKGDDND